MNDAAHAIDSDHTALLVMDYQRSILRPAWRQLPSATSPCDIMPTTPLI